MSKRNDKNDGNGDTLSDAQVRILEDNQMTYDPVTNDVYDPEGQLVSPSVAASVFLEAENPPAGSNWHKGAPDTMFAPTVRSEPDTMGQSALAGPAPGTPSAPFARAGEAIDSDGLMGSPGETYSPRPAVDQRADTGLDDSGTLTDVGTTAPPLRADDFAALGLDATPQSVAAQAQAAARQPAAPPGSPAAALAQARANAERLLGTVMPKADHRGAESGQYVTGPTHPPGTPSGPSHEVRQVDMSNDASASAFIGSPRAPTPASFTTVRVVPPEETKGSSL